MRVGIDISQIVYGTGVSNYTKNLVDALLKIDKKNEYILFGGSLRKIGELHNYCATVRGNSTLKIFPFSPTIADFIWNRLHILPIENFVGNVDVFHSSDWAQPPTRRAKLVTTIHDLVPILYPESSHPKIVATHKRRLSHVKREVDLVIAVSESTRDDIIAYLDIPRGKIHVIYEAPDKGIKKLDDRGLGETLKRHGLPKEYLLVVGTDPRKNVARIAKAAEKVSKNLPVIIVGRKWSDAPHSIKTSQGRSNIYWVGHVGYDVLSALYSGAKALVYASLYEGFGLPILNAFRCGCPVVTSNVSSMPEVAGNAAVLVNPQDVDDIANGIEQALSKRDDLIKKGLERVKNFSWEKTARETLKVYKEATIK